MFVHDYVTMTKTFSAVLFASFLLAFFTVKAGKVSKVISQEVVEKSEETTESRQSNDDDDESTSTQIIHRDAIKEKNVNALKLNDSLKEEEEEISQIPDDRNSSRTNPKYDNLFDDLISASNSDDLVIHKNADDIEETVASDNSREESNQQEAIEVEIEQITEANNDAESKEDDTSTISDDEHDWRSAENIQSDGKEYSNEGTNEDVSLEDDDRTYSVDDFGDKKFSSKFRDNVETRTPEIVEHFNMRPISAQPYIPSEERSILDFSPRRSYSEIILPRLHPLFNRNRVLFTPNMFPIQTSPPFLERLVGQRWMQSRQFINPEEEHFNRPQRNRITGRPRYEDSKIIDDYNDYGSNTYSYAPTIKLTTPPPPRQIIPPKKYDIFKKLADASNHPNKVTQRTINENVFPGNLYPQRQYPESYGFDVRRMLREARDEMPFQDI